MLDAPSSEVPIKRKRGRPRKQPLANGAAVAPKAAPPAFTSIDDPEIQSRLRILIRLAKEQDYLTYDDLNEALPMDCLDPDLIEQISNSATREAASAGHSAAQNPHRRTKRSGNRHRRLRMARQRDQAARRGPQQV